MLILSGHPGPTGGIHQVLCTQNIGFQKELRILNAAVHMTLGGKVHDVVELIVCKQLVHEVTVANVSSDEVATLIVNVVGNGCQITCIGQCIQYDDPNVVVVGQQIFHVVRADKSGCPCH